MNVELPLQWSWRTACVLALYIVITIRY